MEIFGKWTKASCSTAINNSEVDKIRENNKASYLKIETMVETTKGANYNLKCLSLKRFIEGEIDQGNITFSYRPLYTV